MKKITFDICRNCHSWPIFLQWNYILKK